MSIIQNGSLKIKQELKATNRKITTTKIITIIIIIIIIVEYAAVQLKKVKIVPNEGLPLHSGNQLSVKEEGYYYKFLSNYEKAKQLEKDEQCDANKEYIRRLSVIWSSPLSFTRKVKATNSFATSVLLYHMWTADWPFEHLGEVDRSTRQIINYNKAKDISMNLIPCSIYL